MNMKKENRMLVAASVVLLAVACTSCKTGKCVRLKSAADSVSYAIGVDAGYGFGKNLKNIPGDKPDVDLLIAGFVRAIKNEKTQMSAEEARKYIESYMESAYQKEMEKNQEEGEEFLRKNKSQEGVQVTASGLQYRILKQGDGSRPSAKDRVKVHYTGTLLDGTVFDSSVKRGEPMELTLSQVIKGWTEGVQLMTVGSKYRFWIPSNLAYGEKGAGGIIKPNSVLCFDIELIDIMK